MSLTLIRPHYSKTVGIQSIECLATAVGKGFHAAPGTTDTFITYVAPGADQRLRQHYQLTHKCRPHKHHPIGPPIAPQGPILVPHEHLAPAVG